MAVAMGQICAFGLPCLSAHVSLERGVCPFRAKAGLVTSRAAKVRLMMPVLFKGGSSHSYLYIALCDSNSNIGRTCHNIKLYILALLFNQQCIFYTHLNLFDTPKTYM